jgi:hypothetical protein
MATPAEYTYSYPPPFTVVPLAAPPESTSSYPPTRRELLATPPKRMYSWPPLATVPIAIPPLEISSVSPTLRTMPDEVTPEEITVVVIDGLHSTGTRFVSDIFNAVTGLWG